MLKFFENGDSCNILLKFPISEQDLDMLSELFSKQYLNWQIDFGFIHCIDIKLIELLYKEIIENKKNIRIITYRYKLNRYLNDLGFHMKFIQPLHRSALNIDEIEVVLIGGSADSSPKVLDIVKNVSLYNLTLVIVQHVEEKRVGEFDSVLQRYTNHKVYYAQDGHMLQKGAIYLAPNNKHLKIKDGCFQLSDDEKYNFAKPSISISYESFSYYYKEKLLIIQECGYGSDGVDKLECSQKQGSKIVIQSKKECEAKSMVVNAHDSGCYNYIMTLEEILLYINLLDENINSLNFIDYLLEAVYKKYGYDFRLYQKSLITRRLSIFMLKYGVQKPKDVIEIILFDKKMFREFFAEISINVTELFRNPKFFSKMSSFLESNYKKFHNIKIWSAGCSSGEEVYSLAILLKKIEMLEKSIIYATDFNQVIIQEAKNGLFSKKTYEEAKKNFKVVDKNDVLDNYVIQNDSYVKIIDEISKKILFFEHNLAKDSSFNEFDIIICKNVLIYFDYDLQKRVFKLFYDSLKFGGHLIIGESEQIHWTLKDKFESYSKEDKIFKKVS